jgi:hypothetical protein
MQLGTGELARADEDGEDDRPRAPAYERRDPLPDAQVPPGLPIAWFLLPVRPA